MTSSTDETVSGTFLEGRSSGERGRPRRRAASIAFLVFGVLVAAYLGTQGPQPQHVRVVLGEAAPDVTSVGLRYVASDGETAREAQFTYARGAAPRIVGHELRLANGEYRLNIDLDLRDGRREVQRQVTLGGGSAQVDVSAALARGTSHGDEAR